jgi:glycosyltransferase involved in cell wall biosynthesis
VRIAMVHSFYSSAQPSGENRVVVDQAEALHEAGHEVLLVARHTDAEEQQAAYALRTGFRVATGLGGDPTAEIRAFKPDIVHIQNLFPNFGTRWALGWDGPLVVSVHNYRAFCSNGVLFRDGQICHECPSHGMRHSVMHACYRDSRLATIPLAVSRRRDGIGLLRRADAIITTSSRSDQLLKRYVSADLPTYLIPNFGAPPSKEPLNAAARSGWVALGRLSAEKGFTELAQVWPRNTPLTIIGDGPDLDRVSAAVAGKDITLLPSVERDVLRGVLPAYVGLVFPSLWHEVAPQVVLEGLRVGLPILARSDSGIADLITESKVGQTFSDTPSLIRGITLITNRLDELSQEVLSTYSQQYSQEAWRIGMERVYDHASHR